MWAVASTLQSTMAELAMTELIHSSKNSSCAYCVHSLGNQSRLLDALQCNKCCSKFTHEVLSLCVFGSYSGCWVPVQNSRQHCLSTADLGSLRSAVLLLLCISFSTFVSLPTGIFFAVFKFWPQLYDFTSNFTRRLMALGTNSFSFPNARKLDTSLLFSSIRGMRYSLLLYKMNNSSIPWFHSIFLFHLLSFLSIIFHISGSSLFFLTVTL